MFVNTGEELIEVCKNKGKTIWQYTVDIESKETGLSKEEIFKKMEKVLSTMKHAVDKGMKEGVESVSGIIGNDSPKLYKYSKSNETICGEFVVEAMAKALGTSEVNAAMGRIVASPKMCIRDRGTSDLLVIDKINKKEEQEGYVSNYFIENYLECTLEKTTRDKTKEFITNAEKWTQKAFKENAESANEVRNTIKKKLREEDSINIENLATEMFHDNEEAKESFNTYLLEKGVKDTIDLDKNYIEKKLKRVRLKIDKDIDIYLSEEAYNDNMRFEIKPNGDGSVNMIIKNVINYIEK